MCECVLHECVCVCVCVGEVMCITVRERERKRRARERQSGVEGERESRCAGPVKQASRNVGGGERGGEGERKAGEKEGREEE